MRTFWEAEQEKWYIPIPHNRQDNQHERQNGSSQQRFSSMAGDVDN